jgi:uncharacterized protein (TIGR02246 family)
MTPDEQAIATILTTYQDLLNRSDTNAIMGLYADDAVFMAQNSPSSVGIAAIHTAYTPIFAAITLTVVFDIAEVIQTSPDWAFARTNSAGTVTIHATGEKTAEANQELFVFHKIDSTWKITRYCFSTTNPPR